MVAAAAIVGGTALVGGIVQYDAQRSAANKQRDAAQNAANLQQSQYQQTRSDLAPYRDAGAAALGKYNALLGVGGDPSQIQKTLSTLPGYQFTLNQGLMAVQNSAAARGLGSSGAAMRGAADYASGLADSRYNEYLNQLYNASAMGQNAAAQTGTFGQAAAQGAGNALIGGTNAQAAAQVGGTNALVGGLQTAANAYGQSQMFNALQAKSGGVYSPNQY